ncbi:MAG: SPASM domain-containing protein [Bacteroidales bacterium]|nr:SPASM domain-containing protein [Bacteroidales bacterium]
MPGLFVKPANAILSGFSWARSSITRKPFVAGMPSAVSVELTNHCNLECPECHAGSGTIKREKGFMNLSLYSKIISELKPYIFNVNLYFQGEPMMHPHFFAFLKEEGMRKVVSTNGHFLNAENCMKLALSSLSEIIVSLDGTTAETYKIYRKGGDFEQVLTGLKLLSEAIKSSGSSLRLRIQFLVHRHNEHQVPEVKRLARELNASLHLKSMQIMNYESIDYWMPSSERFRRYKRLNGTWRIKSSLPDRCSRIWFNPVITWNGLVLPCCFDKDADYVMGDLKTDTFRDIWNGTKFRAFRKSILTGRRMTDICRNCTSGLPAYISC